MGDARKHTNTLFFEHNPADPIDWASLIRTRLFRIPRYFFDLKPNSLRFALFFLVLQYRYFCSTRLFDHHDFRPSWNKLTIAEKLLILYSVTFNVLFESLVICGVRAGGARGLQPPPPPPTEITQFLGQNAHDSGNDT